MQNLPVIFGISTYQLTEAEIDLFKSSSPYGIILFGRNIQNLRQTYNLCQSIKAIDPRIKILIDEEGGRVTRLKNIYPEILPAAASLNNEADKIIACYKEMAVRLKKLGIDVCCAPVADLGQAITHEIIGDRAFSDEPEKVIASAGLASQTLLDQHILPVIKHLPGHGRAKADSHLELPRITTNLRELLATDFKIFAQLNQFPLAMTAHIIYDALDPELPVTLSKKALKFIREELNYQGKIMTDDLNMLALAKYDLASRVNLALEAGCDLILHCNGVYQEILEITKLLK